MKPRILHEQGRHVSCSMNLNLEKVVCIDTCQHMEP